MLKGGSGSSRYRDLWWRKGHTGKDCQEMILEYLGLEEVHPRTRIRGEVMRAIWDSLVDVGREKTEGNREKLSGIGGGREELSGEVGVGIDGGIVRPWW